LRSVCTKACSRYRHKLVFLFFKRIHFLSLYFQIINLAKLRFECETLYYKHLSTVHLCTHALPPVINCVMSLKICAFSFPFELHCETVLINDGLECDHSCTVTPHVTSTVVAPVRHYTISHLSAVFPTNPPGEVICYVKADELIHVTTVSVNK
jgi:hypothetical protein